MKKYLSFFDCRLPDGVFQSFLSLSRDYYINVDMSKYVALLIDTLNHDQSISELLNPAERIQNILKKYGQR